ncbi:MAG: glycosyltransferase family 4 protein [Deltaproteobacteria bacterium]|nr:glycosyltransferase family 4 protein [Deltaproteobacteria bacterium]
MDNTTYFGTVKNVGFVSTRLAGTDGVSLETAKWEQIFEQEGFNCFYFAGELDRPPEQSYLAAEAHFTHPEIDEIQSKVFDVSVRQRSTTEKIHQLARKLKDDLYNFIEKFDLDLIIPQNALTIPMNIPLGVAITQVIMETGLPTIAHHHDFYWERDRFMTNGVWDYLRMAFPPDLPSIDHVTINSFANAQLALRCGVAGTVIPNVMDFENPPPPPDDYTSDVRQAFGIQDDELFVLQPTRVVARKGIDTAIELVSRLGKKAKLVISHASGDEGYDYQNRLKEYSEFLNVNTIFVDDIIDEQRGSTEDGRKIYTLSDIFPYCDLVTYPSTFEGFGNAFMEAVYFHKPIVVNRYSIYTKDIKPRGFRAIELDGYVTATAVKETKEILENTSLCEEVVNHNYEIGKRFFSYSVLRRLLKGYIAEHMTIKA